MLELLERPDAQVIALGGGAVGSEPVREALARPHRGAPGGGARGGVAAGLRITAGRWRATPSALRSCTVTVRRSTNRWPTRWCRPASARASGARCTPCARSRTPLPARGWCGPRRLRASIRSSSAEGLIASGFFFPREGRRFVVTDENVARAAPLGVPTSRSWCPAGETHKTLGGAEQVLRALARAGAERRRPRGGGGRGRGGRRGRPMCRPVPARHAPRTGAHQPGGPGRLRLRGQDRRGPARGQELRGCLPPAVRRALRSRPAEHAAARRAGRRLRGGGQDGPDRRRAAVGARAQGRGRGHRDDHGLRAHQARRGGGRRARRGPPSGAEPRPHGGHAIEAATSYGRYRHGEAVAVGLLVALRLSSRDALRDEVAGCWRRAGCRCRSPAPRSTRCSS